MFSDTGLRRFDGMILPGNGVPDSGSMIGVAEREKSPDLSAWVRTILVPALSRLDRIAS